MAESYFFLASAGLDAEKSLKVYDTMATFATAGSFDMARATDLLTDSLSALGWASENAAEYGRNMTRLSDMVVKGNTLANTSVEQLAEALMNRGAAAMTRFNQSAETGLAALLVLADKGFAKGGEAGMQLAMALEGLNKVWLNHADKMRKVGVEVYDKATGKFRDMADILDDLNGYLNTLSGEGQQQFMVGTLGMEARAVRVVDVLRGVTDKLREYDQALGDASGTTADIAAKNLDNLASKWRQFRVSLTDTIFQLISGIAPALEGFVELLTAVVQKVTEAFGLGNMKNLTSIAEGWAKSFRAAADAVRKMSLKGGGFEQLMHFIKEGLIAGGSFVGKVMLSALVRGGAAVARAITGALTMPIRKKFSILSPEPPRAWTKKDYEELGFEPPPGRFGPGDTTKEYADDFLGDVQKAMDESLNRVLNAASLLGAAAPKGRGAGFPGAGFGMAGMAAGFGVRQAEQTKNAHQIGKAMVTGAGKLFGGAGRFQTDTTREHFGQLGEKLFRNAVAFGEGVGKAMARIPGALAGGAGMLATAVPQRRGFWRGRRQGHGPYPGGASRWGGDVGYGRHANRTRPGVDDPKLTEHGRAHSKRHLRAERRKATSGNGKAAHQGARGHQKNR
jgi:TP901 family phage tail tape measure protein